MTTGSKMTSEVLTGDVYERVRGDIWARVETYTAPDFDFSGWTATAKSYFDEDMRRFLKTSYVPYIPGNTGGTFTGVNLR